jgi:hypothetical protein
MVWRWPSPEEWIYVTAIGALIIACSTLYMARREARLGKRATA